MTSLSFLNLIVFGASLSALSAALTWLLMKRVRIIDTPNERSSHTNPTPRSGGIAIVASFYIGLLGLWLLSENSVFEQAYFWAFCGAALVISAVSIVDDVAGLGFRTRLGVQIACAALVAAFGIVVEHISLPGIGIWHLGWVAYPLTVVWIVGLTNAFNFMDGIDGIAGTTAIVAAGFFGAILFLQGSSVLYLVSALIVWASLGFLLWNWQPAKIFMGDSGSQFLGFALATLAVMAGCFDESQMSLYVMPLLFFHYIWDTSYTLIRRWRAGERITEAHRSHLYQLMNRLGASHARVTSVYMAIGVLQGLGALVLVNLDGSQRVLVFLPFIALQVMLTRAVTQRARQAELIV
ncbi:glycosyltransferase family 4 protein [Magnetovibrio blakemorei]|uniref:UDP-phosphate alpha-N-acetylglucosaminyl 1-phosphate transferase n=1 Tax=Magnetovibrio blakemorei TaxID=28181 RepID=A0A1E5Q9G0_9PROT|nr:MraY family glycosyltransferase [Magnetovibrio blakemorei]OEJ68140.1 hypothetical protein BEN30_07555 [Magnetovibrio blakemorei]